MTTEQKNIRRATCAGDWYPKSPVELTKLIASFFSECPKIPLESPVSALIVPHAGYVYSGKTAAKAYKQIEGKQYDTVVVISPSHNVFFQGCSVFDGDGYATPLGVVEIDKEMSEKIADILPSVYLSNMGHGAGEDRGEHALELQLPFLQIVLGKFKLVAIVMGEQEESTVNALSEVLAATITGTNTLLVASTDLSHFYPEKQANRLDGELRKAVENYDPELLMEKLERGKTEACGGGIVASVLKATKRLGGSRVEVFEYTTSGAVTGDFDEVVGYLSAAVITGNKIVQKKRSILGVPVAQPKKETLITDEDKVILKEIASKAIEAQIHKKSYSAPLIEKLDIKRGLFVSIKINGNLRGCIGQIKAKEPLFDAVAHMAVAAAFDDPRFDELSEEEFQKIEIEISVLSPLKRIHDFAEIEIGKHGLLMNYDMHSGLLLPQVAEENNWNVTQFLEQISLKAGLPKNSYKEKSVELYTFEAEVF